MGRSFNSVVQEMRVNDEKTYALLKDNLKKDFLAMMETNARYVTSYRTVFIISSSTSLHFLFLFCYYIIILIAFHVSPTSDRAFY